jgi:uncharacterized protein (DUF2147 family)
LSKTFFILVNTRSVKFGRIFALARTFYLKDPVMKSIIFPVLLFFSISVCAQRNEDAIVGKWLKIPRKDMVIEVSKENNEYVGRITWTREHDIKKPHGFRIMDKLQYNAEKKIWEKGKIYDPSSGSTYSATAKLASGGTLEVHGYKGMKFLGKTKYFERVE